MSRCVVAGLGAIGVGLASHLTDLGWQVAGYDNESSRADAWCAAQPTATVIEPHQVAEYGPLAVIVAVRTGEQVFDVLAHLGEIEASVAVITTLSAADARRLTAAAGLRVVEAPVSGGPWGAQTGQLTTMAYAAGGLTPAEHQLLEAYSRRVITFASPGQPALAKLINNTIGAYNAATLAALFPVAERVGFPAERLLDVINDASGASWMSHHFAEFPEDLLLKDVLLLQQEVGVLPTITMADLAALRNAILRARG